MSKSSPKTKKSQANGHSTVIDASPTLDSIEPDTSLHGPQLRHELARMRKDPSAIRELFVTGKYPYQSKMATEDYERGQVDESKDR